MSFGLGKKKIGVHQESLLYITIVSAFPGLNHVMLPDPIILDQRETATFVVYISSSGFAWVMHAKTVRFL